MFILKKTLNPKKDSEKFVSNQQGVVTDFSPIFTIATNKQTTSVVYTIKWIHKIIIFDNNGQTTTQTFNKKYDTYLEKRIFLNDKNIKAYFYLHNEGFSFQGKKIKKIFIQHQL